MVQFGATFCRKKMAAAGAGLTLVVAGLMVPPAEARRWHIHRHAWAQAHHGSHSHRETSIRYHHHAATGGSISHIAAIVVDGNSGQTLYARNEDEQRFPASITKVMTLYLLFEQLEKGHLRLDSDIRISPHAAAQKPTKLGLRPGQTISVDDAIKAVVTRSANDIAVAIAETVGGDEANFAHLMTLKAHALGMSHTHFANASGLPDPEQLTTARDLAILGRAIQERFPHYYHYFSTRVFHYGREAIMNHNHLLGRVEGMDGIKTGYTRASGFNLLTSVKRDGHYIVAVVLGGATSGARDRFMADLIEEEIGKGATVHTASAITGSSANPFAEATDEETSALRSAAKIDARLAYAPSPRLEPAIDPIQIASLNAELPAAKPRPAYVSGAPRPEDTVPPRAASQTSWKQASLDGSTARGVNVNNAAQITPPSTVRPPARPTAAISHGSDRVDGSSENQLQDGAVKVASVRPAAARNGWMIQIGATPDVGKATELLARAKSESRKTLLTAQAFTEKVQKGSETLYRARFAGLEAEAAERTCATLKRSGFSCFATKN